MKSGQEVILFLHTAIYRRAVTTKKKENVLY